jgi:hypothetical protein
VQLLPRSSSVSHDSAKLHAKVGNVKKVITKRLTNEEKSKFKIEGFLKEVLIGNILGDAHMRKFNISEGAKGNARVRFLQSKSQSDFIYHLYDLFKDYCASPPKENFSVIKESGNTRYNISFATRNLPCFNDFYSLFYNNRVKVVPQNIEDFLSPVVLAYWIMGDGSWTGYGLKLHTNNFTKDEVNLLIKSINNKFNFNSSINVSNLEKSQYTIYIPSKDIDNLRSLVLPYILISFHKKLGIKNFN